MIKREVINIMVLYSKIVIFKSFYNISEYITSTQNTNSNTQLSSSYSFDDGVNDSVLAYITVGSGAAVLCLGMFIAFILIWKRKSLLKRNGNVNECNRALIYIL